MGRKATFYTTDPGARKKGESGRTRGRAGGSSARAVSLRLWLSSVRCTCCQTAYDKEEAGARSIFELQAVDLDEEDLPPRWRPASLPSLPPLISPQSPLEHYPLPLPSLAALRPSSPFLKHTRQLPPHVPSLAR